MRVVVFSPVTYIIGRQTVHSLSTDSIYPVSADSVTATDIVCLQCESKKITPTPCDLRFSDILSQMIDNFKSVFYTPITRSCLR